MFGLPKVATAPFCPSEVRGSVAIAPGATTGAKLARFVGPGLLIAVGYMDPGNWATDIEAGSRYGYSLLFVVVLSGLAGMVLQYLAAKLGIAAGRDLARLSREHYPPRVNAVLWILAELSIVACDLAEVLGGALAFHLLLGVSLPLGVGLTALDTFIVLGLKGQKFRELEAIVLGLVLTITVAFVIELWFSQPHWPAVAAGLVPSWDAVKGAEPLYLAVGILGATVMPHNLYLHSSIVQTRVVADTPAAKAEAVRFLGLDSTLSLVIAMGVNAAILMVAAAAFNSHGHHDVTDIQDAYRLLEPVLGSAVAPILFAVALLASGQNSTFTGTVAGQVILEGFLDLDIPCWLRRLITRSLALVPALAGVLWLGDRGVGVLLVASQVVLSLQLPFALWPLMRFTGDRAVMGGLANGVVLRLVGWALFAVIVAANLFLLVQMLA